MKNLQDGIVKQTIRGTYDPSSHERSNDFGLWVSEMFESNFGANIDKCVVNPNKIGEKGYYSPDDGKWDIELSLPEDSLFFDFPISTKKKKVVIEIETKLLKTQFFNISDIWPRHFPTADFGWQKYRDGDKLKEHIAETSKNSEIDMFHFLVLYYVDKEFNLLEDLKYSWCINIRDLEKCPIEEKNTSRFKNDKVYAVKTSHEKMALLNIFTGKQVELGKDVILLNGEEIVV